MTKVKILKNYRVALDGINSTTLQKDDVLEVDDQILKNMISDGACEIFEEKVIEAAEENKAIQKAPEKKTRKRRKKKDAPK